MYTNNKSIFKTAAETLEVEATAISIYLDTNHEHMTHDEKVNCHARILNLTHLMWMIEDKCREEVQNQPELYHQYLVEADEVNQNFFALCHSSEKYI